MLRTARKQLNSTPSRSGIFALLQTKTAGSFDPTATKLNSTPKLTRLTLSPKPQLEISQLACFTGAAVPTFFSIARFRSSARGERTSARAFSKKASRPPLWSTLLIALVETRRRTLRPSASEMKVTLHRFGRKRRLVLMFEWLTLWPTWGPLAVSSQRRDIVQILFHPRTRRPSKGRRGGPKFVQLSFGRRGRIGAAAGYVKVFAAKSDRGKRVANGDGKKQFPALVAANLAAPPRSYPRERGREGERVLVRPPAIRRSSSSARPSAEMMTPNQRPSLHSHTIKR